MTEPKKTKKPRPRRRWWVRLLRVFCMLCLLVMAVAGIGLWVALQNLREIAEWSLERAFPGITVKIGEVRIDDWSALVAEEMTLNDSDGQRLAFLHRGTLRFDFPSLRDRHLGEIRLESPVLVVSPALPGALAREPQTPPSRPGLVDGWLSGWVLDRFVCDFGELYIEEYGAPGLRVSARFAFDWEHLGADSESREHPRRLVLWAIAASLRDNYAEPFLSVDLGEVDFSIGELLSQRAVRAVLVRGGHLALGEDLRRLFPAADPEEEPAPAPQPPDEEETWRITLLEIRDIATGVEDPRPEFSRITFNLNSTLTEIPLTNLAGALGAELQTVELANLEILSPIDPMVRVITLRSVFVRFALAQLLEQRIAQVVILSPTIYLNEDLFIYMERMRETFGADDDAPPTAAVADDAPAWAIDRLRVDFGRLVLGGGRRGELGLPLEFETTIDNIALDNLAALKLDAALHIKETSYAFPALQLELTDLGGTLNFAYPPDRDPSNLVQVLQLAALRWRQFDADDLWLSATFEKGGVSAFFGGRAYGGYLTGGVAYFFQPTSRWVGWVYGSTVDLAALTDVLAPQNLRLTGPADFSIQADALGNSIERVRGDLRADPGRMVITKLDDLLANIPPDWTALKSSSTRIALETLRDFDYDSGRCDFWFVQSQGVIDLRLQGPTGSRNFEVYIHADETTDGLWKNR